MHLKMHNRSTRKDPLLVGGEFQQMVWVFSKCWYKCLQVVQVGIKEVPGVLSTNSMDGCRTKPRTGSSVAPVANCSTSLRPTVPLLPPTKQFPNKMDRYISIN